MPAARGNPFPDHIAIILDGNSRWARERGLDRSAGHRRGVEVVETILDHAAERGVKAVTLYAFSKENWRRPETEKSVLFELLKWFFTHKINKIISRNARLTMIGDLAHFDPDIRRILSEAEERSKGNTGCRIQIALSYGARDEIVRAARRMADDIRGGLDPATVDEERFKGYLDTAREAGDPDLLIRTGGEKRLSNFLLYQIAYTELYFTKTLWPDFTPEDLDGAIADYQARERRFGGRP